MDTAPLEAPAAVASNDSLAAEQYGEILAHIRYFGPAAEAEILARLGIDAPTWTAMNAKWMAALVGEALEDARPVAVAFTAAFAPVYQRLKMEKPGLESIGAQRASSRPSATATQVVVAESDDWPGKVPVGAELVLKPTFLAAGRAAPDGQEMRWARWAGVRAIRDANEVNAAGAPPAALHSTIQTPGPAPAEPSPRSRKTPEDGERPAVTVPLKRAPAALPGTPFGVVAPKTPALPFRESVVAESPHRVRAPKELTGTSDAIDAPCEPALPFVGSVPAELPPARRIRAPAALTGTTDALDAPRGPALPFSGASCAPPDLTLEQYASLRAHLTVRGEDDQETWTAFGVRSRAAKEALQARFAARFRQDAAAQARFVELVRKGVSELRASASPTGG